MNITEETIDSFLRGDLNSAETEAFNKVVSADPKLQHEVSIQKDIIDAVKHHRHQQLKARLNSIDVKPVGIGLFGSPYVKLAASIGIVALVVGSFSWFTNNSPENAAIVSESNVSDISTSEAPIVTNSQHSASVSETENSTSSITDTKAEIAASPSILKPNSSSKTSNNGQTTSNASKGSNEPYDISEEPMDSDNTIEGINGNFEIPSMNPGGNTSNISAPQIKVSIVKENNLGYRFFNNQLYLHGNFSNSTYELFELNNKPSKQLFLYFENNYYELIQGKTKVTALNPITDKATLLQLTQLREH